MVHTVKVKREDIPKELQMLLENGKDSNGEEVFSHMPEDLIYLAALVDMQSSMLHLLMLHGNPLAAGGMEICCLHSENGRCDTGKMGRVCTAIYVRR